MPNKAKNWVDQFRTNLLLDIIREVAWRDIRAPHESVSDIYKKHGLDSGTIFIPKHLLPINSIFIKWWEAQDKEQLISEKTWLRYFNGERSPQGIYLSKIFSVIKEIEGVRNSIGAEKAWGFGPEGAPLWASLKKDKQKIIDAWKPHIRELNKRYTGTILEIFQKAASGEYAIYYSQKSSTGSHNPSTEWKLALSFALIRINWNQYIEVQELEFSFPRGLLYNAEYEYGLDIDLILNKLDIELSEDRMKHHKKWEEINEIVEAYIESLENYDGNNDGIS